MSGMDPEDKKKANDERARLGLGRNRKKQAYQGRGNSSRHSANASNQLYQLKAANAKYKRTIASLNRTNSEGAPSDNDVEMSDAGNAFGGKSKKAKK